MAATFLGNSNGVDQKNLAEVLAKAMEQCGLEEGSGLVNKEFGQAWSTVGTEKGPTIREVDGDDGEARDRRTEAEEILTDAQEEKEQQKEDSPWEIVRSGLQKRLVTCSPLDPPTFRVGSVALVSFRATVMEEGGAERVLDDTHVLGAPLEYMILETPYFPTLRTILEEMRVQELSHFIVDAHLMSGYVPIMAWWRTKTAQRRPAWMASHKDAHLLPTPLDDAPQGSCGYADLDAFQKSMQRVRFELQLCALDEPCVADREFLEAETLAEKEAMVPKLRQRGVDLYKMGRLDMALERFDSALMFCEELLSDETPTGKRFLEFQQMTVPILLNGAQCMLNRAESERAEAHCSMALDIDPDNCKALFRRARARVMHWEPEDARRDYARVLELDPSLKKLVAKELEALAEGEQHALAHTATLLDELRTTGTLQVPGNLKQQFGLPALDFQPGAAGQGAPDGCQAPADSAAGQGAQDGCQAPADLTADSGSTAGSVEALGHDDDEPVELTGGCDAEGEGCEDAEEDGQFDDAGHDDA